MSHEDSMKSENHVKKIRKSYQEMIRKLIKHLPTPGIFGVGEASHLSLSMYL
jgi:hypothetical protein